MTKIPHDRMRALSDNLLHATEPSSTPDDKYPPVGWNNRMYYLALNAGATVVMLAQMKWELSPANLSFEIASRLPIYSPEVFEQLERDVAALIKERFGS
ncbi:MAG: hypothetical protein K2W82_10890 [Candidatus Obscuribacterales bacterium]|nr:hypothetical protein [Candidatus Obscuribacterales bacterium]